VEECEWRHVSSDLTLFLQLTPRGSVGLLRSWGATRLGRCEALGLG